MATCTVKPGNTYKFSTLESSILGSDFDNMRVVGILPPEEAAKHRDIYTIHANIRTLVPSIPADTNTCTFVWFEDVAKKKHILALEWLNVDTLEEIGVSSYSFTIPNLSGVDLGIIRTRLIELGYNVSEIKRQ